MRPSVRAALFSEDQRAEKLRDILRRVIANPHNANEVAAVLAKDWFPMMIVGPKGEVEYDLYGYK